MIGAFSFHCNIWHRILGLGASASRPVRRYGPRTRAGLIRSIFRQSRSAKASLGDGLVADPHGAQSVRDGSAIDAIPIADRGASAQGNASVIWRAIQCAVAWVVSLIH